MRKKIVSILFTVVMTIGIVACGNTMEDDVTEVSAVQQEVNSDASGTDGTQAEITEGTIEDTQTETTEDAQSGSMETTQANTQENVNSATSDNMQEELKHTVDAAFLVSEEKLQAQREEYFEYSGYPDDYATAYEKLDRQQSPHYYRQDNKVSSYSFKNGWDFSFTYDLSTKAELQLQDVLVNEELFWVDAKLYILEQIYQIAGPYNKIVANYQDIVNGMESSLGQWDWYLDAGGLVIYFHPYTLAMDYENLSFTFSYPNWQKHIKEEYQVGTEPIIARISPNCLYPVTDEENLEIIYNPDGEGGSYYITIQTDNAEVVLEGFDFNPPKCYILRETQDTVYLLIETDECLDLDEHIWLLKVENGELTQCGEQIHGKIINVESTDYMEFEELVYDPMSYEDYIEGLSLDMILDEDSWYDLSPYTPVNQIYCITEDGKLETVTERTFHIVAGEDYTYGVWRQTDEASKTVTHFEIRIYDNDKCIHKIVQDVSIYGDDLPKVEEILQIEDMNADKKEDILILAEDYREGETLQYMLYLANEEGFETTYSTTEF